MTGGDVNLMSSATSSDKNQLEQYDEFSFWKEGYNWYYTANKEGAHDVNLKVDYRNITATIPCRILISDYHIIRSEDADEVRVRTGWSWLKPGESCKYIVKNKDGAFSWTIEGEGADIDEASGLVTVKEDAKPGSVLIITATPEDGDLPVCMNLFISSGDDE